MKDRTSLRSLLLLAFVTLLALGVSPLLAQDAAPLTQSAHLSGDGLTLTISYPATWVEDASPQNIFLASNAAALDQIKSGLVSAPGQVGVVAYLPGFLDNLSLPHNADPTQVVNAYIQIAKVTGDVQTSTDFSVPAATAVVASADKPTEKVLLGALAFPTGTVVFGATPNKAVDSTVTAVINSITLISDQSSAPQSTEQISPPITEQAGAAPTTFNTSQPNGTFQLEITLPDGWVNQYDETTSQLYLANSQTALDKLLHSNDALTAGESGITIALPNALTGLGLTLTSAPTDVLTSFETQAKAAGDIKTDTSFSVPAASAVVSGTNIPQGDVAVYALAFDSGTMFIGVLPASAADASMLTVLHSIQFTQVGAAPATPEAQPTQASTESVSLTPTTLDVDQPLGRFEVTISLPDGWVTQNNNSGFIYIGSSQSALVNISGTTGAPGLGESGITILLPNQLVHVGVTHPDSPTAVLTDFEKAFSATGQIQTDSSFGVPAASAHLSGDKIPKGGGVAYALTFDSGTLLILTQPDNEFDATLQAIVHTISLNPAPETAVTTEPQPTAAPTEAPTTVSQAQVVRQWAASADGTSEYGTDNWSFMQATGKPDTTTCDDNVTAWASQDSTGRAVLQLTFAHPVIPTQINVYQTFNPGAITEIDVGSSANPNQVLPLPNSADAPGNTACPGVFSLDVSGVTTPVDFVVIYLDQSLTQNWDEIDAVQLVGTAP